MDPLSQLTASGIAVWGMDRLKQASWFPVVSERSTVVFQRLFAAFVAAVSALGVAYSWDAVSGTLTITGLTETNLTTAFSAWLKSFVTQELIYQGVLKPNRTLEAGQ